MSGGNLIKFDPKLSREEKERGMALAAEVRKDLLRAAQQIARQIAESREDRLCWADLVKEEMQRLELNPEFLGNAAGSLFKGGAWDWTGDHVKSTQVQRHSNEIKVWRLK